MIQIKNQTRVESLTLKLMERTTPFIVEDITLLLWNGKQVKPTTLKRKKSLDSYNLDILVYTY